MQLPDPNIAEGATREKIEAGLADGEWAREEEGGLEVRLWKPLLSIGRRGVAGG